MKWYAVEVEIGTKGERVTVPVEADDHIEAALIGSANSVEWDMAKLGKIIVRSVRRIAPPEDVDLAFMSRNTSGNPAAVPVKRAK